MERTIKFRGRDVITGNWVYGYYYPSKGHAIIRDEKDCECIVLEKTVGQYTELNDDKDVEIYDGDIIENINGTLFQVEWNDDKRLYQTSDGVPLNENANYGTYKLVMGNIHNNPLMLTQ